MVVVSHPTGNQFVRALLGRLEEKQLLARFFTTVHAPSAAWLRLLPVSLGAQLARRSYDLPRSRISARPLREMARLLATAAGAGGLTRHETGWASLDAVYRDLDRAVAARLADSRPEWRAVHCYEDGAEETFRAAGARGIRRVYELPIAWWESLHAILDEEARRLPAWEPTLYSTRDSREKLRRKTTEIELADVVVCPSRFVLESLPEKIRAGKKCVVAMFGSPAAPPASSASGARGTGEKLRVLFAGAMTQRKGIADLFAAMKLLHRQDTELVVMGSPILPMSFYREQFSEFVHEPSRPHAGVIELMRTCDLLVLPSLVEGRALVQQEALACGLPIVVTENAGAADLVEEGRTGFLVPVRSPEAIAEKIAWFAEHRDQLPAMREAACCKAAEYTWEGYADAIIAAGGFEA